MVDLIYCARRNHFAPIALRHGWLYGSQLPNAVYDRPHFVDQNYKKPDRVKYMRALEVYRPAVATVLDLESLSQFDEVLSWASEASQFVSQAVVIIPKCEGVIAQLPRSIGSVEVRLGYSVPTSYGGTSLPPSAFEGWPVHLLGGNPIRQLMLAAPHIDESGRVCRLDVRSVDQNYIQLSAVRWGQYLELSPKQTSIFGFRPPLVWRQLREVGLGSLPDAPYEAFSRSCEVLRGLWTEVLYV